jgi:hypothetical protein
VSAVEQVEPTTDERTERRARAAQYEKERDEAKVWTDQQYVDDPELSLLDLEATKAAYLKAATDLCNARADYWAINLNAENYSNGFGLGLTDEGEKRWDTTSEVVRVAQEIYAVARDEYVVLKAAVADKSHRGLPVDH